MPKKKKSKQQPDNKLTLMLLVLTIINTILVLINNLVDLIEKLLK